ncbi:MAG: dynamin family protein [Sulfurospirillaceae bacterium]|nr:dynamin family protein [Sulfurospirillaceae bacterium]
MNTINDFFLSLWSEKKSFANSDNYAFCIPNVATDEMAYDILSIALSANSENFSKVFLVDEFKRVMVEYFGVFDIEKQSVQQSQMRALLWLKKEASEKVKKALLNRFEMLRAGGVISYDMARKLSSIIELMDVVKSEDKSLHVEIEKKPKKADIYHDKLSILQEAIERFKSCVEETTYAQKAEKISQKLVVQSFSIGVTGVMNAGKSTMLNALLGSEILGTSVVPETANLTVIKYGEKANAIVHFWDALEWSEIEKSAEKSSYIKAFVDETHTIFKERLSDFITLEGRSETIEIKDLPFYTSVEHSNKKCNLVKSVELFSDLEFLKDGVCIVDTPGLDDPVIQREEITLNYLQTCDLLIHLMNVKQSATQKDIDFIIDALTYRNVARLLIVITRIDAVDASELEEVIAYVKSSIKARLEEQERIFGYEAIISKLDFIPISAKYALWHKMGKAKEALALGFDEKRCGLLEVEAYLKKVLFGSSSEKSSLIIASNAKELDSLIRHALKMFEQEKEFLGKTKEQLELSYSLHVERKKAFDMLMDDINSSIFKAQKELEEYFVTLAKVLFQKIVSSKNVLKRRLVEDVSYELQKNNKKPAPTRIETMLCLGIKDMLVDVVREYRYLFFKKLEVFMESVKNKYETFSPENKEQGSYDSKEFFDKHFGSFVVSKNHSIFIEQVKNNIATCRKNEIEKLDIKLDMLMSEEFGQINSFLQDKILHVNTNLLEDFALTCKEPLEMTRGEILHQESIIKEMMKNSQKSAEELADRATFLKQKLVTLNDLLEVVKQLEERA